MRHRRISRLLAAPTLLFTLLIGILGTATPATADVDDFSYSSWTSRYEVGLDDEGRATARVTETLVAEFPEFDQNKGIVRGYPQRYQGAGLSLQVESVTDEAGDPVPYETETDDGVLYVLTGDDDYVHSTTTYVIEYTMRDVMITGTETGADEFHWDLLPLVSSQPVESFRAELVFAPSLAYALTGDVACYQGLEGSTRACEIDGPRTDAGSAVFTVSSGHREAGDGMTVAIGFEAGTVTQPAARTPEPVADFGAPLAAALTFLFSAGAWASVARFIRLRRRATGIVVAQYDVPADLPPLLAAPLVPSAQATVPAQIVHLAVRGALRLEEDAEATGSGKERPVLRLLDRTAAASPLDTAMLDALFPGGTDLRRLPRKSEKFSKKMAKLTAKGVREAASRGWTTKERARGAARFLWGALAGLAVTTGLMIWSITRDRELMPLAVVAFGLALVVVLVTSIVALSKHVVLTPAGAERHEYLMGVREFIRVAEADRIRMLQSHQGAERRADGGIDVVRLYERLLPYAMLFGEEKTWGDVLETAYAETDTSPVWIHGVATASLGARLASFSTTAQASASYSASSSSGGSTGGGFSGSGGGGGFSGGR